MHLNINFEKETFKPSISVEFQLLKIETLFSPNLVVKFSEIVSVVRSFKT